MSRAEELFNDNLNDSIFNSQISLHERIKVKLAMREESLSSNSTSTPSKNTTYSLFKIVKSAFLNFSQFKNEIVFQQNLIDREINKIYLIKGKDQIRSFTFPEEWEEFFNDNKNSDIIEKGIKLEYSLKSKLETDIEKRLNYKGVDIYIDFIDYLQDLSLKDNYFNKKINEFLSDKKLVGESKEYNNIITDNLFNGIKSKVIYYKKVNDIIDSTTPGNSASEIFKGSFPAFESFIEIPKKKDS